MHSYKRASDKLIKIIEEIDIRNFKDLNIFINSENLERKSKLRNFLKKTQNIYVYLFILIIIKHYQD